MKKYIIPSIRLTLVLIVLLCIIYPISIALAGRFSKGNGAGEKITKNGKTIGYALLGQSFTKPAYFWGRPSAVNYNAAGSAGSNKGPSNPDYLKEVQSRIDTLLKYNPGLKKSEIPADMVTASGSGLDPNISEQGATIQIARVAKTRHISEQKVKELVALNTIKPLMGLFGPSSVNVLKLNLALDNL
ncbi:MULTISPECIES: K(+)-transporting ATPase subunit C [unclassified Pedobacter]|jgi:K+-transporting ATPase ATPase C chain|uniref:K(+)-transporting ATPase subunit C n=1 Tax=Pedobacter TaxID=84567 RepID=UPI000B4AFE3B|nr:MULTISPECIES: K(+)-transporting ATPase subunit C [unclassified Pedobacter]MCX2431438.1 K(+)-transporting ATPase subunit C [Pedobacter sp. GR22-10]MCX2584960.1 K(+)-transporting ATPase subunit C [Pedobacter sp. MR22-3]OWK71840.1 potassium-transporting ATPase subunit C [Pedobacter sp. AJM]